MQWISTQMLATLSIMVALNFSFEDLPTSLLEKTDMLIGFSVLDLV